MPDRVIGENGDSGMLTYYSIITVVKYMKKKCYQHIWKDQIRSVQPRTPGLPVHPPSPRVHSNSRPSSQWCHPAISSSVVPFSSCPPSLPASESFPMSQLFAWGGQSTGVSALASFPPKNTQGWSPLEWTGWISLQSKGLSIWKEEHDKSQKFSTKINKDYAEYLTLILQTFPLGEACRKLVTNMGGDALFA